MHLSVWSALENKTIVLASASPRRKEIMQEMGLSFEVVTTLKPDENDPSKYETPEEYVSDTAWMKAKEVYDRCREDPTLNADIVIGADTVVVFKDTILEKPHTQQEALDMIAQLSGNVHKVLTGVWILSKQETDVLSGEPFDKAGGYGIQGSAALFVESIHGDYWNVVGLPKSRLYRELIALLETEPCKE
ncbi:septum formation protein Maf [Spinellus fusiger]|nr:septum formation protein Maf [Spinellus fusiger]